MYILSTNIDNSPQTLGIDAATKLKDWIRSHSMHSLEMVTLVYNTETVRLCVPKIHFCTTCLTSYNIKIFQLQRARKKLMLIASFFIIK